MKKLKPFLLAAGILAACATTATAQTGVVTVTNFVTVLVTNVVTITNMVVSMPAPKPVTPAAPAPVVPPKTPWESSASLGLSLTRGNSQTLLFTAGLQTHRKTVTDEYGLGLDGSYGENNSVKSADLIHAFGQWNHLFSDRTFSYLRSEGVRDEIADINYRITLSPGVGYYFLKEKYTSLAGEVGPGVVFEELGKQQSTFATMRVAERFEHKFFDGGARVWQSVEILPQVDKWDKYLVNFEVGVESALSKNLSLQVTKVDLWQIYVS